MSIATKGEYFDTLEVNPNFEIRALEYITRLLGRMGYAKIMHNDMLSWRGEVIGEYATIEVYRYDSDPYESSDEPNTADLMSYETITDQLAGVCDEWCNMFADEALAR